MTTSFSAGSTAFGDTPSDDTHQFTGSLNISGSSVKGYSSQPPTAILANPANTGSYGLHVRGINRGIRLDRFNSTNASAFTNIYQNGSDWTMIVQNTSGEIDSDADQNTNLGIGVNRIGGAFYPQNNSIDFYSYDLKRTRLGKTQLTMDNDVTFSLPYNRNFIVSGSEIEFTPTEKVEITNNLDVSGDITGSILHIKNATDAGIILEDSGESSGVGNVRIRSEGGELKIESLNASFATHKTILRTVSNTGLTRFVGGQDTQAQISVGGVYGVNNSDNSAGVRLGYSSTNTTFRITDTTDGSAQFTLDNTTGHAAFKGNVEPMTDNNSNLGSSTKRWANIHSADLHLSNEDTEGNEVDGTTGNWVIQEGEDDLYLLNRKNGKKYRFKLEEIK